jgi:hypothetical protein
VLGSNVVDDHLISLDQEAGTLQEIPGSLGVGMRLEGAFNDPLGARGYLRLLDAHLADARYAVTAVVLVPLAHLVSGPSRTAATGLFLL